VVGDQPLAQPQLNPRARAAEVEAARLLRASR
jgi:hypothetical protein